MPLWLTLLIVVLIVLILGTVIWALTRATYRTSRYGHGWIDGFTDALFWWWVFDSFEWPDFSLDFPSFD